MLADYTISECQLTAPCFFAELGISYSVFIFVMTTLLFLAYNKYL